MTPAKTVILVCEKREKFNDYSGTGRLLSVSSVGRCNEWTRHDIDRVDADGTLHYKCAECGAVRVFGSWLGGRIQIEPVTP
jgi:hypothetical protein